MALPLTIALCCAALLAGGPASVLCYGAGLALTLALAAYLTPAAWWRKPTARGLLVVAAGTWACGSALALATPALSDWHARRAPRPATAPPLTVPGAAAPRPAPQSPPWPIPAAAIANQPFRVHRPLNLRAGPAVASARLAIIPAGAQLTPTGQRAGDWWQVQTSHGGPTGWVSSLWLRHPAESAN